jgi:flagellin
MASFGDFNKVNTNVTAMEARLSLNKINAELGNSRLKLSTGYKINKAEDDSAGFAIATKLRSRITGLEQALQNVSDAKSVMDVIEGAYSSIMDNLIEMKGLATQAANDTLSSAERTLIAKQINGLSTDINSVASSTTFNGIELLPATAGTLTFQVGEGTSDTMAVTLNDVDVLELFSNGAAAADLGSANNASTDATVIDVTITGDNGVAAGNDESIDGDSATNTPRGAIDFDLDGNGEVVAAAIDFNAFMTHVDTAIGRLNGYMNQLGIDQRSLSGKEVNLTEAISANSAAKSRIMDVDFAKEQSNSVRLQILQQTATAALSQANMGPQAVLGFLGQ